MKQILTTVLEMADGFLFPSWVAMKDTANQPYDFATQGSDTYFQATRLELLDNLLPSLLCSSAESSGITGRVTLCCARLSDLLQLFSVPARHCPLPHHPPHTSANALLKNYYALHNTKKCWPTWKKQWLFQIAGGNDMRRWHEGTGTIYWSKCLYVWLRWNCNIRNKGCLWTIMEFFLRC